MTTHPTERFEIALNTPAGRVVTEVDVPAGFVPVTSIVPFLRRLGEEAQALEEARASKEGRTRSCTRGCAACCRMLVPLSPPEAFGLMDHIRLLPVRQRERIDARLAEAKSILRANGIWQTLLDLGELAQPPHDEELSPINEAYYSLRMPCPFLEDDICSIYNERPSACRELLVTSPADQCQDMVNNAVDALPVPVRMSPVLGLLWGHLTGTPPRMIPLPIVAEWVERHELDNQKTWRGPQLLDAALDTVWRFMSQAVDRSQGQAP